MKRLIAVTFAAGLLLGGCVTSSLIELQATDPIWTGPGTTAPEQVAYCTQDYLEDRYTTLFAFSPYIGVEYAHRPGALIASYGSGTIPPKGTIFEVTFAPDATSVRLDEVRPGQKRALLDALTHCLSRRTSP
jgi:hypothetical protein